MRKPSALPALLTQLKEAVALVGLEPTVVPVNAKLVGGAGAVAKLTALEAGPTPAAM